MVTEHLFHYPIGLLGVLGIIYGIRQVARAGRIPSAQADIKLAAGLFLCVFLPMLASLPDAVHPQHARKTAFSYLHFLPAVLYICVVCRKPAAREFILKSLVIFIALLVFDALVQFFFGQNLLGFPRDSAVLTGMFDTNQRLGLVLALFLPLVLFVLHARARNNVWWWLFLIPFAVVILFSLKRSAWVMIIVGSLLYLAVFVRLGQISWRTKLLGPAALLLVIGATAHFVPSVGKTLEVTLGALTADYETLDIATSRRLTLWQTGSAMAQENLLNGVGPRGYRYVYKNYAGADDFWIKQNGKGQTHPHLMGLEVLVETGIVGVFGLLLFFYLLFRALLAQQQTNPQAAMWLILALVAWFPLNTHLAFYGSYWSSFAWLFIAIGVSAYRPSRA